MLCAPWPSPPSRGPAPSADVFGVSMSFPAATWVAPPPPLEGLLYLMSPHCDDTLPCTSTSEANLNPLPLCRSCNPLPWLLYTPKLSEPTRDAVGATCCGGCYGRRGGDGGCSGRRVGSGGCCRGRGGGRGCYGGRGGCVGRSDGGGRWWGHRIMCNHAPVRQSRHHRGRHCNRYRHRRRRRRRRRPRLRSYFSERVSCPSQAARRTCRLRHRR